MLVLSSGPVVERIDAKLADNAKNDCRIERLSVDLPDDADVRAASVLQVIDDEECAADATKGGVLDQRLGAISRDLPCTYPHCAGMMEGNNSVHMTETNRDQYECPGHYGHIELPRPVFTTATLPIVYHLLRCFCPFCGQLLLWGNKRAQVMEAARQADTVMDALVLIAAATKSVTTCRPSKIDEAVALSAIDSKQYCGRTLPTISMPKKRGKGKINEARWFALQATFPAKRSPRATYTLNEDQRPLGKQFPITAARAYEALRVLRIEILVHEAGMFAGDEEAAKHFVSAMVLRALPVMPPCARPSVMLMNGSCSEHDFTKRYRIILGHCTKLRAHLQRTNLDEQLGSFTATSMDESRSLEHEANLQYNYNAMCSASASRHVPLNCPPRDLPSSDFKSIDLLHKGKHGRHRQNLQGKRVDFSGRTVLTPDPNLAIGQVGVPLHFASVLTYPERVTPLNIGRLTMLIARTQLPPSSTACVISADGLIQRSFRMCRQEHYALEIGEIVERPLQDGDIVLINRQPTLHRPSGMAMRVVLLPGNTFRFTLSVMNPMNADCDGDELNLHVPQNVQAVAECHVLMSVIDNILLPQNGKPCMGASQDSLLGLYLLSRRDQFFTRADFMQLLFVSTRGQSAKHIDFSLPRPAIVKSPGGPRWTGKQLLSKIMPKSFCMYQEQEDFDEPLRIVNGEVLSGRFIKSVVGAKQRSIVHRLLLSTAYDSAETRRIDVQTFFDCMEMMGKECMEMLGFSIGLADMMLRRDQDRAAVRACIDSVDAEVAKCIAEHERKQYTPSAHLERGKTRSGVVEADERISTLERAIIGTQERINSQAGKLAASALRAQSYRNSLDDMGKCGSKGSSLNIWQMLASVGGQMIEGHRVCDYDAISLVPQSPATGMSARGEVPHSSRLLSSIRPRIMPHFLNVYPGAQQGGNVKSSFMAGLKPAEFFFHAMGARKGLTDTSTGTADTGYIQRRMSKALGDLFVRYDGTVRRCDDSIVQFSFGADPSHVQSKDVPQLAWPDAQLHDQYVCPEEAPVLQRERRRIERAIQSLRQLSALQDRMDAVPRLFTIGYLSDELASLPCSIEPASYCEAALQVEQFLHEMRERSLFPDDAHEHEAVLQLASRKLVDKHCLDVSTLSLFLRRLERQYVRCTAQPGDSVGILSAQSMGESSTQRTLNSFHVAGTKGAMVGGLERMKEIVLLRSTMAMKTPEIRLFLDKTVLEVGQNAFEADRLLLQSNCANALSIELRGNECDLLGSIAELAPKYKSVECTLHKISEHGIAWTLQDECDDTPLFAAFAYVCVGLFGAYYPVRLFRKQQRVYTLIDRESPFWERIVARPPSTLPFLLGGTSDGSAFPLSLPVPAGLFAARPELGTQLTAMLARLKEQCPPASERTAEEVHRRHMYKTIVPYCDQMNSVFVHNVLLETRICYEPLDADGNFWMPRLDAQVSDNERRCVKLIYEDLGAFGSTEPEQSMAAAEAFVKRTQQKLSDGTASTEHANRAAAEQRAAKDPFLPTCAPRCSWSNDPDAAEIACIGSFALTLQLDMRYYHFAGVDRDSLECFLRDTVLQGKCLCSVAPYMDGEATFAVRIRLRYCREFTGAMSAEIDEYTLLRQKERHVHMALLQGPRNARNASIERLQLPHYSSGGKQMHNHLYIATRMRNMQYAMGLKDIDFSRIESNIIPEIYRVLGIRAARAAIVHELEEMSASGGCSVDRHYIALIADTMCATGEVLPFTHSGVCKMHNDYTIHTAYEQQNQTMLRAAQNQASVPVVSPDASINVGQRVAHMGTNSFSVLIDYRLLENAVAQSDFGIEKPQLRIAPPKRKLPATYRNNHQSPQRNGHTLTAQSPLPATGDFSPIRESENGELFGAETYTQTSPVYSASEFSAMYSSSAIGPGGSGGSGGSVYSPTYTSSPGHSSTYNIASPAFSPSSPTYDIAPPAYSPSSPTYGITSPAYSPSSPAYYPNSPTYDVSSPVYAADAQTETYTPSSST